MLIRKATACFGQNFEVGSVGFGFRIMVLGFSVKNFSVKFFWVSANFWSICQSFVMSEKCLFGVRFFRLFSFSSVSSSSARTPSPKLVSVG